MTAEDLAALQTDVLAGYVFAQAAAGAGKAWQEAADRGGRAPISTDMVKDYAAAFESAGGDELIFIRATASPGQLELLAGAVL